MELAKESQKAVNELAMENMDEDESRRSHGGWLDAGELE